MQQQHRRPRPLALRFQGVQSTDDAREVALTPSMAQVESLESEQNVDSAAYQQDPRGLALASRTRSSRM